MAGIITSGGVVAAPGIAPDAGIAAIRVFGNSGGGRFSDIDAALDWVLDNRAALGIRVVNLSLGDGGQYGSPAAFPCSGSNTASAVSALVSAGVAVFAASGNEGFDAGISFPACVGSAISVGGVYDANVGPVSWCGNAQCTTILCTDNPTTADKFVCHSNSGANLDLLAPDWRTDAPQEGGGTHAFGGTSAASPYAAGEAAVLFAGAAEPHARGAAQPDEGARAARDESRERARVPAHRRGGRARDADRPRRRRAHRRGRGGPGHRIRSTPTATATGSPTARR